MTRRAIGSYSLDASKHEKMIALRNCIVDAALELLELGASEDNVREQIEDAISWREDTLASYESGEAK